MLIRRFRSVTSAECEGCRNFDGDSTREQVRAHVRLTGHAARVTVEDVTRYDPEAREGEQR
jgi:hypothetical protein